MEASSGSILTKQQVRRGIYHDVPEVIAAIEHLIEGHNELTKPCAWTKTPSKSSAEAIKDQNSDYANP